MKTMRLIVPMIVLIAVAVSVRAQQHGHPSIHQIESEYHHWDEVRLDARVPDFARGQDFARQGQTQRAIAAFLKGARENPASGYFNLGLVYFYTHRYSTALHYFQRAERIRPDSASRSYRDASERLIRQHSLKRNP